MPSYRVIIHSRKITGSCRKLKTVHLLHNMQSSDPLCGAEFIPEKYGFYCTLPPNTCPSCLRLYEENPRGELYATPSFAVPQELYKLPLCSNLVELIWKYGKTVRWIKYLRSEYCQDIHGNVCHCNGCSPFEDEHYVYPKTLETGHCCQCRCDRCVCPMRRALNLYDPDYSKTESNVVLPGEKNDCACNNCVQHFSVSHA